MSNAVDMHGGGAIVDSRAPNVNVINMLEDYLEMAKSGEITTALICVTDCYGTQTSSFRGTATYGLVGVLSAGQRELLGMLADD